MKNSTRISLLLILVLVITALLPEGNAAADQSADRGATLNLFGPSGVILDTTPTFTWERIKEQPDYEVRLVQFKEVFTRLVTCSTTPNCEFTSPYTLGYKDYYWQVRLKNGTWSSPMKFVVSSPSFTTNFTWGMAGWARYKRVGGIWDTTSSYAWTDGQDGVWSPLYHKADSGKYIDFDYTVIIKRWAGNKGLSFPANCLMARMGTFLNLKYYWYPGYRFCIANNGEYEIWYRGMSTADSHAIQRWKPSAAIRKGSAWNKLRVVAEGTNFQFYINDVLVKTFSDDAKDRGYVGVMMYKYAAIDTELDIDFAQLTVIETTGAARSTFEKAEKLPFSEEDVIGTR